MRAMPLYVANRSRLPKRDTWRTSPMTAATMTGPTPNPGQAGPGRPDRGGGFLPGLADPRVDAAQILRKLGEEPPAGRVHHPRRRDRLQDLPGLACGDLPRNAAGHQLAQHLVQPARPAIREAHARDGAGTSANVPVRMRASTPGVTGPALTG